MAAANHPLRSLIFLLLIPLSLTTATISFFGSGQQYRALAQTTGLPSLRAIHLGSMGSSFLMGFSAWLVWAEGGFRGPSDALALYIAQVSLSLVFHPLVLEIGAAYLGLVFCLLYFGTTVGCYEKFRRANPVAEALVTLCLAWVAFLTFVNFKLVLI